MREIAKDYHAVGENVMYASVILDDLKKSSRSKPLSMMHLSDFEINEKRLSANEIQFKYEKDGIIKSVVLKSKGCIKKKKVMHNKRRFNI